MVSAGNRNILSFHTELNLICKLLISCRRSVFDINKENPAVNKLEKAKVTLIKIDANNESKKLPGAEFELFTADGKNIGTYITDEKGEINISDLAFGV